MKKPTRTSILVRGVYRNSRAEFKKWCSLNDTTMSEVIRMIIEETCQKNSILGEEVIPLLLKRRQALLEIIERADRGNL